MTELELLQQRSSEVDTMRRLRHDLEEGSPIAEARKAVRAATEEIQRLRLEVAEREELIATLRAENEKLDRELQAAGRVIEMTPIGRA